MGYGSQTVSFSYKRKMKDYIEECQAFANTFTHRSYPSRPNPSPFAKQYKAIPGKRNVVTRCNIKKLSKLKKKINVGYHPTFSGRMGLPKSGKQKPHPGFYLCPTSCTSSNTNSANKSVLYIHAAKHSSSCTYPTFGNLV